MNKLKFTAPNIISNRRHRHPNKWQLRVMKLVYDDTVRMNELNSAQTLCQREKIIQQSDFTPKYDFVTGIDYLSLPLSEVPYALGTINPMGGEDIKAGYYMTPDYNDEHVNEEG